MAKLIMWNMMTLDGLIEGPNREIDWHEHVWGEELEAYSNDTGRAAGGLLFGRVTYELMAGHWPTAKGEVAELARTLRDNEAVRLGETVYKTSAQRNTKIVDVLGFAEWLGEDWHNVVPFSPSTGNSLKVKGLAAVCERRGVDMRTVQETFTETEWGEPRLVAIPVSKAPQYMQRLGHGESTFRRKS